MKKSSVLGTVLGSALFLFVLATSVNAAPDPNFHIYLAFGQSNMEGQGPIEAQDSTVDSRFQVLWSADDGSCHQDVSEGEWIDAVPPLSHCKGAGLSPADYFGRTMVEKMDSNIRVGIVNVSVAGCSIQLFDKDDYLTYVDKQKNVNWMIQRINTYGGNPYGRLIEMAKKAQEDGVIKGIIFHQGETDATDTTWPSKVKKVYDNIIEDLGLGDDIPFLAGEVLRVGASSSANQNIAKLPRQSSNFYVVSSEAYNQANPDGQNVHFTSQEYRDFGKRYAQKMIEVLGDKINLVPVSSSSVESSSAESSSSKAVSSSSAKSSSSKAVSSSSAKSSSSKAVSSSSAKSSSSKAVSSSSAKSSSSKAKSSSSKKGGKDAIVAQGVVPQFTVSVVGRNVLISGAFVGSAYAVLDMQGSVLVKGRVDAVNFSLPINRTGTYLVNVGNQVQTVAIR
jgi:hypothetical protein